MVVVNNAPTEITRSATIVTFLNPYLPCNAAAKGPMKPNSKRLMLIDVPTVARLHPNSSFNGSIRIPGAERKPAAPSNVMKATPKTTHE
jgi:hypothetical protein